MSIFAVPKPTERQPYLERLIHAITRAEDILAFPMMGTETETGTDGGGGGGGDNGPDLTAIEALTGTGILCRTAADTWALRTLMAPAAGLQITNPAGIGGNPTFALANDLAALEALAGTGFAVRTGSDTWAQRTLLPGDASILITNGNGVSGNPTIAVFPSGLDHNQLANLAVGDVHTQYARLLGRAGGQTLIGGTGAGDDLILRSTSHATKGTLDLDDAVRAWPSMPAPSGTTRVVDHNPTVTWSISAEYFGFVFRPAITFNGANVSDQSAFRMEGTQQAGTNTNTGVLRALDVAAIFESADANFIPPGTVRLFDDRTTTRASADTVNLAGSIPTHYGLHCVPAFSTFGALAAASLQVANLAALRFAPSLGTAVAGQQVSVTNLRGIWLAAVSAGGPGTQSATTYVGIDVENQTIGATNLSLRSAGANVQMRHAGPAAFGVNAAPNATLDDAGSLALRQASVSIVNGANNDLNVGTTANVRLTGGGASAALNSIQGGVDGRVLLLINETGSNIAVNNNGGGTAANQILTRTGAAVTLGALSALLLKYDTVASRWRQITLI